MTYSLLLPALLVLAPAAPAPLAKDPRPVAPSELLGYWNMQWLGQTYIAHFHSDGAYTCWGAGRVWIGTWRLEGGNTLVVCEREGGLYEPSPPLTTYATTPRGYTWKAALERGRARAWNGSMQQTVGQANRMQLEPGATPDKITALASANPSYR